MNKPFEERFNKIQIQNFFHQYNAGALSSPTRLIDACQTQKKTKTLS